MSDQQQFIELSFINDPSEIRKQIVNTVAITYLLSKGFAPTNLNSFLESTQYGYNAASRHEGRHLLTRITDINGGAVNWNTVPFCDCEDEEKYLLKKNDILIARTGGTTGKTFLITEVPPNAIFASYLIRLRANKKCLPEFMNLFLNSYVFWSQISELKAGSAQPNVNAEKLKTLSIPNCPISIQRRVIAIVKRLEIEKDVFSLELCERIERALDVFNGYQEIRNEVEKQRSYLVLLRQTILQEAVQGKLTKRSLNDEPAHVLLKRIKAENEVLVRAGKHKKEKDLLTIAKDEVPFELPEGWVWCRLGEIANVKSGVTLGKVYKEELFEVPYLRVANVQRGHIDITHLKTIRVTRSEIEKYSLDDGDLCMIEGGDWDKVGRCGIWKNQITPCIHQNHIFRLRFYGSISNEWAEIYLNSPIARRFFESFSKQTTNLASINKTQLTNLLFPLPSLAEQQNIAVKVRSLQQHLRELEAQVQQSWEYAEQLFRKVLKEAFQPGEIKLPNKKRDRLALANPV